MGSSIGVLSAIIANNIQPSGSLISIEAAEDLAIYSKKWIESRYANSKIITGFGFPIYSLPHGLKINSFDNYGFSLGGLVDFSIEHNYEESKKNNSKIFDIKTLCSLYNFPSPDALVIDIEGSESILLEKDACIPDSIKLIIIELHPKLYKNKNADKEKIIQFFNQQGLNTVEQISNSYAFVRHKK
jgi:hypothetical protein